MDRGSPWLTNDQVVIFNLVIDEIDTNLKFKIDIRIYPSRSADLIYKDLIPELETESILASCGNDKNDKWKMLYVKWEIIYELEKLDKFEGIWINI